MYEEPNFPVNATEYIKRQLGADTSVDTDALRAENEQLKLEVDQYKARVEELERQVYLIFIYYIYSWKNLNKDKHNLFSKFICKLIAFFD